MPEAFSENCQSKCAGVIVIDPALAGQKVRDARDAGENAEKVACEEEKRGVDHPLTFDSMAALKCLAIE